MTKLIVAFRNFANAPKKPTLATHRIILVHESDSLYILLIVPVLYSRRLHPRNYTACVHQRAAHENIHFVVETCRGRIDGFIQQNHTMTLCLIIRMLL